MSLVTKLARPDILALQPYRHAAWDPALERLHANENPWRFPGDNSRAGLNRYPEPHPYALEERLARLYGVSPSWLLAGRGSDEGIDLLLRSFCAAGRDAVLICPPTFGMYAVAARVQGADVVEVPLVRATGYALDEAAIAAALVPAVKLVFFCTPNNPTGNTLDTAVIERIARRVAERALVIVDEAYAEFAAGPGWIARLAELPNLVVLRTLSKAYALAGARCGVVIAAPEVIELLRRVIPPYAIPAPTSEAVQLALEEPRLVQAHARIARLKAERTRLATQLAGLSVIARVLPSEANFLLVECREPAAVMTAARRAGLLLRDFSGGALTPRCIRISIGTPEQSDRLLQSLAAP